MSIKNLFISLLLLCLFSILAPSALAEEKFSRSSASFAALLQSQDNDSRVTTLTNYLEAHNSKLAPYASAFVNQADYYHLDWKLVVAISGVESTFGRNEPEGCNNDWGYGIYGTHMLCFPSYYEAIRTVSKALREQYLDKWGAQDVYAIGDLYAASPTWADRVTFFMNDIDSFAHRVDDNSLSISL